MTFLMIVTLLLSAGLYLAREYFAASYHDPLLLMFLDITIIAAIVESISLPVVALLRREMAFGMLARIRTAGSGFGAAVTIAMATCGFGHMCFAYGLLASALMTTGLAMTIYPRTPVASLFRQLWCSLEVWNLSRRQCGAEQDMRNVSSTDAWAFHADCICWHI